MKEMINKYPPSCAHTCPEPDAQHALPEGHREGVRAGAGRYVGHATCWIEVETQNLLFAVKSYLICVVKSYARSTFASVIGHLAFVGADLRVRPLERIS